MKNLQFDPFHDIGEFRILKCSFRYRIDHKIFQFLHDFSFLEMYLLNDIDQIHFYLETALNCVEKNK